VAQGLIVEGVSDLEVWQTSDPRAQAMEGRIARAWPASGSRTDGWDPARIGALREITGAIAVLPVDYDDWQIVYRKALQLGRALHGQPQLLAGLVRRELSTPPRVNGDVAAARAPADGASVIDSPAWIAVAVGATMAFGVGALVSYVGAGRRPSWPALPGREWLQETWRRLG
jgi:hypothetical protein